MKWFDSEISGYNDEALFLFHFLSFAHLLKFLVLVALCCFVIVILRIANRQQDKQTQRTQIQKCNTITVTFEFRIKSKPSIELCLQKRNTWFFKVHCWNGAAVLVANTRSSIR